MIQSIISAFCGLVDGVWMRGDGWLASQMGVIPGESDKVRGDQGLVVDILDV